MLPTMLKEQLKRLLQERHFEAAAEQFLAAAKPSIRLQGCSEADPDRAPFSRLGGLPEMPASVEWPRSDTRPLSFLGQLALSEFRSFDAAPLLPERGRLYFFCDLEEFHDGWTHENTPWWRVIFVEDEAAPVSTVSPPEGLKPDVILSTLPVILRQELTLPAPRSIEMDRLPDLGENWEPYWDLQTELSSAWVSDSARHRVMGHPDAVQGCMQRTAQFISHQAYLPADVYSFYEHERAAELMPGAHDWVLLLQVDSDMRLSNSYFGDAGTLFFWIHRDDLAARRFEKVWFFMQCT